LWSLIFMFSMAPGAVANVYIERFFAKRYGPLSRLDKHKNYIYDIMMINLSGNVAQFIILSLFFWVDFLPYFGTCGNSTEFMSGFHDATICLFDPSLCPRAWFLGLIFFVSFFSQGLISVFLSPDSANFVNIAMTLTTPVSVVTFKVLQNNFPLNEDEISPEWSIIPAVFLLLCGTVTWKLWEMSEKIRIKKSVLNGSHEELSING